MKLALPLLTIFLVFSWYVVPAPNTPQEPMPVFSMQDIKPRVHPWKTYHDRIEPETVIYKRVSRK